VGTGQGVEVASVASVPGWIVLVALGRSGGHGDSSPDRR
jgi:hypothetical protein